MRQRYDTLNPRVVHCVAATMLLNHLPLKDYKRSVTAALLADLLLAMAASASTLCAVVRRQFAFGREVARRAIYGSLPPLKALTECVADLLHAVASFNRADRRREWTLAIDTHNVPFYGHRRTKGIVGGKKKAGTKYFHVYASAVLLHRGRRFTVGLLPVPASLKPHDIVRTLLEQIRGRGLRVGGVALDSGFDSGETILLLQELGVNYVVPLRRKGKGNNRRNACFSLPHGTIAEVAWKTEVSRRNVATRALVWNRSGEDRARVYAFGGWGRSKAVSEHRRARLARQRYRERFGIETSYRQKNQGRAWTTGTKVEYRFLLEALGHVLRQLWVLLTQAIARARGLASAVWVSELTMADVLDWIGDTLEKLYPIERSIELKNQPIEFVL